MLAALIVFVVVAGAVVGGYVAWQRYPARKAERDLESRLRDVAPVAIVDDASVVVQRATGPIPALDRLIFATPSLGWAPRLVEQSGVQTTASAVIVFSVATAVLGGVLAAVFVRLPFAAVGGAVAGLAAPFVFLGRKRTLRIRAFEEQFPDALDLMARAIRAGHAFQTSLGMVADEVSAPVGPEFKKTFDQQNFGLPVKDALNGLADRVPLLDVRFFVTAVAIQRESGGNLSEILENLGHVVRERFKIRRQVRIHTAHGRFTGYVLMALPAALAVALSYISPDQMQLLFRNHMGQMMLGGAVVLQGIGFFWIRQVIKIEV